MMAVPSRLGLASRNAGSESAALEKGRVWRGFGRKLIETNETQARWTLGRSWRTLPGRRLPCLDVQLDHLSVTKCHIHVWIKSTLFQNLDRLYWQFQTFFLWWDSFGANLMFILVQTYLLKQMWKGIFTELVLKNGNCTFKLQNQKTILHYFGRNLPRKKLLLLADL